MTELQKCFSSGLSYPDYVNLIGDLLAENRTTGPNQSEAYIAYTRQNLQRMRRADKISKREVEQGGFDAGVVSGHYKWLVFTEAWCGDAANIIPVLAAAAVRHASIDMKLVMRDANPAVFDHFLTNGSRSIPKLVIMDAAHDEVLATWGPRPKEAQALFLKLRQDEAPMEVLIESLTRWYVTDKGRSTLKEVAALMENLFTAKT